MKERRIVQFALGGDYQDVGMHRSPRGELLYALDEEGVLWFLPLLAKPDTEASSARWVALPALPERGTEASGSEELVPGPVGSRIEQEAASTLAPPELELSLERRAAARPAIAEETSTPGIAEFEVEPEPAIGEKGRVAAEYERDELMGVHPPLSPRTLLEEGVPKAASRLPDPGFPGSVRPAELDDA